uniref:Uncharacterized protein n=1 Tax=Ixodes ricinus TaxID=34613 RepID=A0A0K8R711_IXORI
MSVCVLASGDRWNHVYLKTDSKQFMQAGFKDLVRFYLFFFLFKGLLYSHVCNTLCSDSPEKNESVSRQSFKRRSATPVLEN